MKLTRKEIIELANAHVGLSNAEDPKNPFKFGPKVRYSLAKNLRKLKSAVSSVDVARDATIAELSNGGDHIDREDPQYKVFVKKWEDFLAQTEEVDLMVINEADLALDENAVPISILAALDPIIASS